MIQLIRYTLLVLFLQMFAISWVHADQLSDVQLRKKLLCGIMGDDEPFSFYAPKTREAQGYDVDLCKAVAKKLNVSVEFIAMTSADRIPNLVSKKVDILSATLTHNRERESQIDFSLSTFISHQKILTKSSFTDGGINGLKNKKISYIRNSTVELNLRKNLQNTEIIPFDSGKSAFLSVLTGHTVGYADEESALVARLGELHPKTRKEFVILPEHIGVEHLAMGIRKGEVQMKKMVDETLRELEASGKANELFMKWFGPGTKINFPQRPFKIETDQIPD